MIKSERTIDEKISIEYSYFLTSLDCTAEEFLKYRRSHWGIENQLHWVLDVSFNEDQSRIRIGNSQENLSVIRHIALNLLKQEKTLKLGIKGKMINCALDTKYLEKVLGIK
ncbi:transposase DDE domain protein [Clostridium tepidiprofundi DSM 19306]|uniref:Transposase DDE domain protein n=2 Tax=Clostridium TaxID=1485 RepID=A0A151AC70_9CLOT|nr:transposase DDE domain protein [Clostridium tepidiprofundi DSM 19306]